MSTTPNQHRLTTLFCKSHRGTYPIQPNLDSFSVRESSTLSFSLLLRFPYPLSAFLTVFPVFSFSFLPSSPQRPLVLYQSRVKGSGVRRFLGSSKMKPPGGPVTPLNTYLSLLSRPRNQENPHRVRRNQWYLYPTETGVSEGVPDSGESVLNRKEVESVLVSVPSGSSRSSLSTSLSLTFVRWVPPVSFLTFHPSLHRSVRLPS